MSTSLCDQVNSLPHYVNVYHTSDKDYIHTDIDCWGDYSCDEKIAKLCPQMVGPNWDAARFCNSKAGYKCWQGKAPTDGCTYNICAQLVAPEKMQSCSAKSDCPDSVCDEFKDYPKCEPICIGSGLAGDDAKQCYAKVWNRPCCEGKCLDDGPPDQSGMGPVVGWYCGNNDQAWKDTFVPRSLEMFSWIH